MARRPKKAEDLLQVLGSDLAVPDLREYFHLDRPRDPPLYSGARYDVLDNGGARQEVKDIVEADVDRAAVGSAAYGGHLVVEAGSKTARTLISGANAASASAGTRLAPRHGRRELT